MGKYSNIATTLARKPEASDFQTKVDEHKRSVTETTPATLAHALIKIRAEKETIKKALSRINVRLVAHEQILTEAFEDAGVATIKLDTGASVSTQIKPYARVHDRAAFRQWCIDHGLEAALVLPWQSTNALVAERLMDGLAEPDGIDTYKQTTIIVRKGRS
jgi:hypothetical protein